MPTKLQRFHLDAADMPPQELTTVLGHRISCSMPVPQSTIFFEYRTNAEAANEAYGRQLRFLANVDPVDVARALNGLSPETTLVVVVSKTFTTSETMLNARTVRSVCC